MPQHRWTSEEEHLMIKGINEGLKPSEIKQKYLPSIDLSSIQHKVRREKANKYKSKEYAPKFKPTPTTKGICINRT